MQLIFGVKFEDDDEVRNCEENTFVLFKLILLLREKLVPIELFKKFVLERLKFFSESLSLLLIVKSILCSRGAFLFLKEFNVEVESGELSTVVELEEDTKLFPYVIFKFESACCVVVDEVDDGREICLVISNGSSFLIEQYFRSEKFSL